MTKLQKAVVSVLILDVLVIVESIKLLSGGGSHRLIAAAVGAALGGLFVAGLNVLGRRFKRSGTPRGVADGRIRRRRWRPSETGLAVISGAAVVVAANSGAVPESGIAGFADILLLAGTVAIATGRRLG